MAKKAANSKYFGIVIGTLGLLGASTLIVEGIKNNKLKNESEWVLSGRDLDIEHRHLTYYGFDDNKDGITDKVTGEYIIFEKCENYDINSDYIKSLMQEHNLK